MNIDETTQGTGEREYMNIRGTDIFIGQQRSMGMERKKMVARGRRKIKRMCESPLGVGEELARVWTGDKIWRQSVSQTF